MGVEAPRWWRWLLTLEGCFFAFLTTVPLNALPEKVGRRAALVSSRRVSPRRSRVHAKLIGVVPRDGIEPPKNLHINGLDAALDQDITSIPDKIPDKKTKV